ncbi:hypothetical protein OGAPHI_003255 [Ogataea philodendri]|uniref:MATE efflux family protein n=1 Tax=Ogataea philodendri TaxID=1378263 RepID=A0A9P8P814_9ASCO|nr:uncharacterized protein OGAPHI_003255 [Ogataea philodendri]KAH3666806.1 hypothetical protein OGAPHI_003255 [Ogataea philodendri]
MNTARAPRRPSTRSYLDDDDVSLLADESFHQYGSISEEHYIQSRRASMKSSMSQLTMLNLVPTRTTDVGLILEVETSVVQELGLLSLSALPLVITFLLQFSLTVASVFSVGNLGSQELAAVSLSNLLCNVSAYAIIQGIASSLSTLCPQAYGRKDYRSVGMHSLRCLVLLLLLYIPMFSFLHWGSRPLLMKIIQDEQLSDLASSYLKRLIYGVPGYIVFEVLKQFLQAQGIFHASTLVLVLCAPLNIFLNYQLVWNERFGIGFLGAPTAVVITNWCMATMLFCYARFVNGYRCWCGFSADVFRNWNKTLRLAGPGVIMIEAEWLAFEIITFASSKFGTAALASQSIMTTTGSTIYQIPLAISVAASTRVAWFIGSASKNAAVRASHAALWMSLLFGAFNAVLLVHFRTTVVGLFSSDPAVIELASKVLIIGAAYQVNDAIACVSGGVLRGQGRQYISGWLNLVSYYVFALPIAFACGFNLHMGLIGLWVGMMCALCFVSLAECYYVLTTDWDNLIKKSIEDGIKEHTSFSDALRDQASFQEVVIPGSASLRPVRSHALLPIPV